MHQPGAAVAVVGFAWPADVEGLVEQGLGLIGDADQGGVLIVELEGVAHLEVEFLGAVLGGDDLVGLLGPLSLGELRPPESLGRGAVAGAHDVRAVVTGHARAAVQRLDVLDAVGARDGLGHLVGLLDGLDDLDDRVGLRAVDGLTLALGGALGAQEDGDRRQEADRDGDGDDGGHHPAGVVAHFLESLADHHASRLARAVLMVSACGDSKSSTIRPSKSMSARSA